MRGAAVRPRLHRGRRRHPGRQRPPGIGGGLIYCYYSELDLIGHVHGCRSEAWRLQLELIDAGARLLADRLPPGTRLLVTADHGMLDVPEAAKIDYDSEPALQEGVELLAGEGRVRYLHVAPGSSMRCAHGGSRCSVTGWRC